MSAHLFSNISKKQEPKSVTIVRKVYEIQQSLIARRLPLNMVENGINGSVLMNMTIQMLTPALWSDVTEERSVGGVCGYPFCKNKIAALKNKRRKYGVSLKAAKLLNIEGRDGFCSTNCWKASKVLHASLSKISPQLRDIADYDKNITNRNIAKKQPTTEEPSNLLSALKIVESDLANSIPPAPPIILHSQQDIIDGYRVKRPAPKQHALKTCRTNMHEDKNFEDEMIIIGNDGEVLTTVNEDMHLKMTSLFEAWCTDITHSFLRNSIRVPLKGRDTSQLFQQRCSALYKMLCQQKRVVTNLNLDQATLNDDIRCMIATFQFNTNIPSLDYKEIKVMLGIMLKELMSAAWQEERGENCDANVNVIVKLLDSDGGTVDKTDCKKSSNYFHDGAYVHVKKSSINPPEENIQSKMVPSVIYDGSKEEIVQIPKINSHLYAVPGRAGAKPLGKKKVASNRKMKKITTPDGKYPLGYGI